MAIFNTTAYPGDESYRSFLNTVMSGGDRFDRASELLVHRRANAISQFVLRLAQFPKPLVARMSGTLTGEELGVLLACDFRFATSDVTFTFPNMALGYPPTGALVFYLLQCLGPAETTRLLYSTKSLPVSEALELGLVSVTVPKNKLDTQCMEKLTELAALPPLAVAATRRMIQPDPLELSRFLTNSHETAWDALARMDKVSQRSKTPPVRSALAAARAHDLSYRPPVNPFRRMSYMGRKPPLGNHGCISSPERRETTNSGNSDGLRIQNSTFCFRIDSLSRLFLQLT